jgi:geranylgeranyl pyrophosphate synthase
MNKKTAQQTSEQILEKNGGKIADKAKLILLEDPALKKLHEPLEFISNRWRDMTSALMSLSCEAVGGNAEDTYDAALALSLINLSFTVWDDAVDNAKVKAFRPTLYGKFGQDIAIIVGGVASAKAFTILNQTNLPDNKRKAIAEIMWELWSKMATVEATALKMRERGTQSSKFKLWKMKAEAIDLAASLKIGAVIGNGSKEQIEHLCTYGKNLALILALTLDYQVSINLTLELAEKIRSNRLPYSVLWGSEHSPSCRSELIRLRSRQDATAEDINRFINAFLDSGIVRHLSKKVHNCKKKCDFELSFITGKKASRSLKALIDAHCQIFNDRLKVG